MAVLRAGPTKLNDTSTDKLQVELKQINPDQAFRPNSVYRPGDSVIANSKHYICNNEFTSGASLSAGDLTANFEENYVHMRDGSQGTGYMPEDYFKNTQPTITLDGDSNESESSTTLGWVFDSTAAGNIWGLAAIQGQYQTATDYRGLERYLTSKSLTLALPQPAGNRDVSITNQNNQEFRRPSIIRMYGHAYEWAGFGNYTKGLPQYQGGMLTANKFTYYGTSELGGRVYFTGFNEEGFTVSPRGIEDIQTGEVLSVEEINAPDVELDIPTTFDNLTVTNTLTAGQIDVATLNITSTVSGLPESSTSNKGIIETATVPEATTGTDTERAVTPAGLAAAIAAAVANIQSVPSGQVSWFAGTTAPTGYLSCDGAAVSRTTYAALYTAIGDTYGAGDGSTTFNLPNLQGKFLRGWTSSNTGAYNETTNPDPSRTFGSLQNNEIQSHGHTYTEPNSGAGHQHSGGQDGGNCDSGGQSQSAPANTGFATTDITITGPSNIGGNTVDTNANETRPTNVALLPIIKT